MRTRFVVRSMRSRGSITVVMASLITLIVMVCVAGAAAVSVFATQVRASQAADLAALAGAQNIWVDQSTACPSALVVAHEHGATVTACDAQDLDVQVAVSLTLPAPLSLLGEVRALARAGPPE
jgi:secretion/DNA translocation related TadE-like protein